MSTTTGYTLSATTVLPFADAVERVRAELQEAFDTLLAEVSPARVAA